jgi:hypothetical protein
MMVMIDMKKAGLIFGLLMFGFLGMQGQNLTLSHGDVNVTNDTVVISGPVSQEYYEAKIAVTNNMDIALALKVRKTEIQGPAGGENSFCWGECYTPAVTLSPSTITVASHGTDRNSFIADYRPNGEAGSSIVRYTFFLPADTTIQASVIIIWQVGSSGTGSLEPVKPLIRAYPNPADQFITITLSGQTTGRNEAILVNIQGQTVLSKTTPSGIRQFTWNTGNLSAGIYFLKIRDDGGHMSVQKIWIKR